MMIVMKVDDECVREYEGLGETVVRSEAGGDGGMKGKAGFVAEDIDSIGKG